MRFFISGFEKFRNKNLLNFFSRAPKPEIHFVLDIGTESVKGLILEKKPALASAAAGEEEKISVLGSSLEYYDRFSAFSTSQFEREVIKRTILKSIADLERESGIKKKALILGLPPNIFVSRVIFQSHKRKEGGLIEKKEKEEILKEILEKGRKEIAKIHAEERGILPEDLRLLSLKILETKIDGYAVPDISDFDGKNLEFRLLAALLPKYYSEENIVKELGFEISGVNNEVEGLIPFLSQEPEGIFLDIGGEVTQIFLAKKGLLEKICEFKGGGKDFSNALSERLGLDEPAARALKHQYAKRDVTEDSRKRISKFFEIGAWSWFKNLKEKLKEMSSGIFPSELFIFGGGALLPEIEEILEQGDWEDISFAASPKVELLQFKNLNLSPQYISPLLCYCASQIGRGSG
jgi:cell division ATPase FtsA